jgi:crotonobetaine/carnitine-CoA ligase
MGRWDDKAEKAARKWASWRMQEYAQSDRVLTHIIEDKARRNPNHVVFQFRDTPITLGQLNEQINKAANGFLALGVKQGDKVAIMLPNCPEFLYAWFGLNKIGAVEVPINVALKGAGLAYQIVQSDSVALVADTEYLDSLPDVADDLTSVRHVAFVNSAGAGTPLPKWQRLEAAVVQRADGPAGARAQHQEPLPRARDDPVHVGHDWRLERGGDEPPLLVRHLVRGRQICPLYGG